MKRHYPLAPKNFDIRGSEFDRVDPENHYSFQEICNVKQWLSNPMKYLPRTTTSDSLQALLNIKDGRFPLLDKMKNGKVFAKVFPEMLLDESVYGDKDNSLHREVLMLRYLSYLLKYHITPCIANHIADFPCILTKKGDIKKFSAIFPRLAGDRVKLFTANPMVRYLLMEYLDGPFISKWIQEKPTLEDFKSVLFQVLYTCYQLYLSGVMHSDLHGANIIIVKNPDPKPFLFITKDYSVEIQGNYIAKIFDFDRAVFYRGKPLVTTGHEDICKHYGTCPEENRARDPVNILTSIYYWASMIKEDKEGKAIFDYMDSFADKISSDPYNMIKTLTSKYKKSFSGILCLQMNKCTNWVPSEELFHTFNQMVEENAFNLDFKSHKNIPGLKKLAEEQLLYCGRTFMSLDVVDEKRKILIEKTNFVKKN